MEAHRRLEEVDGLRGYRWDASALVTQEFTRQRDVTNKQLIHNAVYNGKLLWIPDRAMARGLVLSVQAVGQEARPCHLSDLCQEEECP